LISYITQYIDNEMRNNEIVGLGIALVRGEQVLWSKGFGYAQRETGMPVTSQSLFHMASISKLFTAISVMKLVEQGRIDLDAPVTHYVPDFSIQNRFSDTSPVTVRMLLTHHSGLPSDIFNGSKYVGSPPPDYQSLYKEALKQLAQEYLCFRPGEYFSYSNLGYDLLGQILEKVSGMSYGEYVRQSIFIPLGMNQSTMNPADADPNLLARGYSYGKPQERVFSRDLPAAGLISSMDDMARFLMMVAARGSVQDREILTPDGFATMIEPQNADVKMDGDFRIGLGFWLGSYGLNVKRAVFHEGTLGIYNSFLLAVPEYGLGVVVVVNCASGENSVWNIAQKAMEGMLMAYAGVDPLPPEKETSAAKQMPDYSDLVGVYASPMGLVDVMNTAGKLSIKFLGQELDMIPVSPSAFRLSLKLLGFIPITVSQLDDIRISVSRSEDGNFLYFYLRGILAAVAEKFYPAEITIPDVWIKRAGFYRMVNQAGAPEFSDFKLVYDRDRNILAMGGLSDGTFVEVAIKPLSTDQAVTIGKGRNLGEVIQVVNEGGIEYLVFSGYRITKN
jgi:CubicO group peptidase (beta-lactamase class C family)